MSKRYEYSFNGILVVDDIQRNVSNDEGFPTVEIEATGRIKKWYFILLIQDGGLFICPAIFCLGKPQVLIHSYFNVIKKDGSSAFTEEKKWNRSYCDIGKDMNIQEILDEKNGFLNDDGGLLIEYGIQVESFQEEDGIWRFNFFDTVFNCQKLGNMISFMSDNRELEFLHCHKQLLIFHSNHFDSKSTENQMIEIAPDMEYETLEQCLQIAHGVRLQVSIRDIDKVIFAAREFGLQNVVDYCEQELMKFGPAMIEAAINSNMNRYLAHLMKYVKSSEELKRMLEYVKIEKMSGEAMKQCAKFFFKNSK